MHRSITPGSATSGYGGNNLPQTVVHVTLDGQQLRHTMRQEIAKSNTDFARSYGGVAGR